MLLISRFIDLQHLQKYMGRGKARNSVFGYFDHDRQEMKLTYAILGLSGLIIIFLVGGLWLEEAIVFLCGL